MKYIYIFKGRDDKYIELEEKGAHNYMRHRQSRERKDLIYQGAIDEVALSNKIMNIAKEAESKYGLWSTRSDEDTIAMRKEINEALKLARDEAYALADKSILPRNFDWVGEDGDILKNKALFAGFR